MMLRALVLTLLLALAVECNAATTPTEPPLKSDFATVSEPAELVPRGQATLIGLVVPDFPDKLVNAGSSLEVRLGLIIDDFGHMTIVIVDSQSSPVDEAVRDAALRWFVIPSICLGSGWTSKMVRTAVVFSAEEDKKFVTIKDPRWYAIGRDAQLRQAGSSTTPSEKALKMRQPLDKPVFPKIAIQRGIQNGVVAGIVQFDGNGQATDLELPFQWPSSIFESSVRHAVLKWTVDPEDEAVKEGKPFRACFNVRFDLR